MKLNHWILFLFALSFTFFSIQAGDVLMYLAVARDFLVHGQLPSEDPYLYSLAHAPLQVVHEWLSMLGFYLAWSVAGFAGLTLLKMTLLGAMFALVLRAEPVRANSELLWVGLWILAVIAGSFRFIERSSVFSDLFCLWLLTSLLNEQRARWPFIFLLTVLFLIWVQVHPGFPLGLMLLGVWWSWRMVTQPEFRSRRSVGFVLPIFALFLNPTGWRGFLYPFLFAQHEAQVFRHYNFEWFASYHPAFVGSPEVIAFWVLALMGGLLMWKQKSWLTLPGLLLALVVLIGASAVRFVPFASFAMLVLVKPWTTLKLNLRFQKWALMGVLILMMALAIKNLTSGYHSSSGMRIAAFGLDPKFFPIETVRFLADHPLPGRLYNAHDYGSYLIWQRQLPIFHHGFVTDVDFYERDVVGALQGPERFSQLQQKYNWTMLLVDKHGTYPYFFQILSPRPEWKIVAEDESAYLIYLLPDKGGK